MENDNFLRTKAKFTMERKEFLRKITNLNRGNLEHAFLSRKMRTPIVISAISRNKKGERINLEKLHQRALKQALAEKMLNDSFSSNIGTDNSIKTTLNNSVIVPSNSNTSKSNIPEEQPKVNIFIETTQPSNLIKSERDSTELKSTIPKPPKLNQDNVSSPKKPDNKITMNPKVHYINSKVSEYKEENRENKVVKKMRTLSSPKVMFKTGLGNPQTNRPPDETQNHLIITPTNQTGRGLEKLTNSPLKTETDMNDQSFTLNQNNMIFMKRGFETNPRSPANYLSFKRGSDPVQFSMGYNSRRIRSFNKRELLKPIQLSNSYNRNLIEEFDFELDIKSLKVSDIRRKYMGDMSNSKEFNQTHTGLSDMYQNSKCTSEEKREGNKDSTSSTDQLTGSNQTDHHRRVRSHHNSRFYVPLPVRRVSENKKPSPEKKKKDDIAEINSDNSSEDSTFREYVLTTNGNATPNVELETLHKTNLLIQ